MEHSSLHALQLCGLVIALGGPIFMLAIFFPARRRMAGAPIADVLANSVARWVCFGSLAGALASFLNLFVDVAEVRNQTIFGGASLAEVWRFASVPMVGRFYSLQVITLLLTAAAARIPGPAKWPITGLLALAATVFTSLVSHAAAQPINRTQFIAFQLTHISAAAIWLGALIHLLFIRRKIEAMTDPRDTALIAEIVRRFSPIALTAVILIALTGVTTAVRYLVTPAAVPTSAYGLTLMVKLTLIIPLLYAGFVNYRVIRPGLIALAAGTGERTPLLRRFGKMLELEVTAGVLVVTIAGIVASVSPPAGTKDLTLTHAQARALMTPDLPTTAVVNPEKFYGAAERTVDDLRYAEFTHNWSGIMVTIMGLCWLVQSLRGRFSSFAEKAWPFTLIPFAIFIAVAADPEVWILRKVSLVQAFTDPALLEHQIGALLVLVLVWLGWRDRRKAAETRPLGYALPTLMILGSLLLLGHAHSALTATQELTNLVNVQHAIFGTFGLFAGVVRWLELRELFPHRIARPLWPGLVVGLGLFMTFFYREVV